MPKKPKKAQGKVMTSGMPSWSVSEPYLNVWITDTPLSYWRADGTEHSFTLRYGQRNEREDNWGWGFGPRWECNRLSYLEFDPEVQPDVVYQYQPKGGRRSYPSPEYYQPPQIYEYRTRSWLEFNYDTNGVVQKIDILWPNGAKSIYGFRYTLASGLVRYHLTEQINPEGRTTSYTYTLVNSRVHLTAIQDRDGLTTSFVYGNNQFPHQVTAITNSTYGLGIQITYDAAGRLASLVDAAGMASSFNYNNLNWITQMSTPYATTVFQLTGVGSYLVGVGWGYSRSCLVTEADGVSKHLFVYRDGDATGPDPMNLVPESWPDEDWPGNKLPWANTLDGSRWMQYRNSWYWGPHQYQQINPNFRASNGDLSLLVAADFTFARLRHWHHRNDPLRWYYQEVSSTLSMERAPSPDGINPGVSFWYDHVDKWQDWPEWEGTFSPQPSLIACVMTNGTAWGILYTRNDLGQVTQQVEYWRDTNNFDHFRTNRFLYAANGMDLVAHYGPGEEFEAGYAYDANHPHLPVAVTNALGEVTRYYYDAANGHRLLGVAHPNNLSLSNYYSGAWLAHTVEYQGAPLPDNARRTNSFTWLNGLLRTHTDPRGLTRTYTHDALGRLTRVDFPDNTWIQYAYTNGAGVMLLDRTAVRDRLGYWTRFEYNGLRQVVRVLDPLLRETRYTYCGCGGPESVTRAWGTPVAETTQYAYDYAGRLTLTIAPDGTTVTNVYDRLGRLIAVQRPYGSTTHTYDNLGRLERVENAAGIVSELAYDDHDRILWQTDQHGVTVTNAYDALGRLLRRVTLANNATESWGYTAGVSGPTAYTNQLGRVTRFDYDVLGRKTLEAQVGVFTNQFTYTPAGDLATLADGKGNVTTWKYDAEGRVTEKWYQGQSTADLLYSYNANGWLAWRFTRTGSGANTNGYFTTYTYDAVGNLLTVTYPAGTASITNQYDALDRLTNRLDGLGQTRYSYAVLGNGQRTFTEDGP
jgi:YD repeat-containing protein